MGGLAGKEGGAPGMGRRAVSQDGKWSPRGALKSLSSLSLFELSLFDSALVRDKRAPCVLMYYYSKTVRSSGKSSVAGFFSGWPVRGTQLRRARPFALSCAGCFLAC